VARSFRQTTSQIHTRLRATFDSGKTLPLEYRRAQLLALARLTQENADALLGALHSDLGRHKLEGNLPEISPVVAGCILSANSLEEWTKSEKPQVEEWRSSYDTTIHKAPKGVVINIV
jgi:aldehyde dehydrogenase (NAD+)